ncbi:MAG TPA: PAS domain-containing protein [Flavobacterium sp.]|jgi:PAS domain S-box-containing protein
MSNQINDNSSVNRYPVAGISACDSCWTELDDFFSQIEQDSAIIYIINTPDSADVLRKNLEQVTILPIRILEDGVLSPNTIYVLPAHVKQHLFFEDLAEKYSDFAIAVCIHDQDKYTTAGFSAIKKHGGITFSSQVAHALPQSLLDVTDFISAVHFIPKQLQLLSSRFEKQKLLLKTKAQIEETEERFRIMADTAPVLIWLADIDKQCFFLNKSWLDYTGKTLEQEVGFGWAEGIHPDDRERALSIFDENFDARAEFYLEYRLRHHSGEYRWISDKGVPRYTAEGEFVGFVGGCMDIHEQKNIKDILEQKVAERTSEINLQKNELLKQKEFSETVFNTTVDIMLVYDSETRFLAFNNAFKKIYNVSDADLGKKFLEVFPYAKGARADVDMRRAITGELVHSEIYESASVNRYFELFYIPLEIGRTVLIVGHDITDRMISEQRLKKLNDQLQLQNDIFRHAEENAMIGSYSWNIKSGEMKYSDNLYRLFGFEPNSFVPDFDRFIESIHPDDKEKAKENGSKTIETRTLFENIYRIVTPPGEIKYCRSTGNFVGSGDDVSLIGTVQDITKDIHLNEALQNKNIELQNSNDDLASFNYIASHDLQEPLRKIHMFSSRILERDGQNFSEKTIEYFARIESAITRMQNLIQALLNYSSTNPADIKVAKTNLNSVLSEVLLNLEESIAEKNAVIESDKLPAIAVIPLQFQQLLLNLISNAIKYSKPDEAPHIKISSGLVAVPEKNNQKYYKIAVADNGIGFDQQYEHKIFDLFQRLHGKTDYEGTGVGLAICKKIIQNHNGFITAEGVPRKGSTFTIYIPAKN